MALLGEIDYKQRCLFLFLLCSLSLDSSVLSLADTVRVGIDMVYLLQVRHFDPILPSPIAQRDDASQVYRNVMLYPVQ